MQDNLLRAVFKEECTRSHGKQLQLRLGASLGLQRANRHWLDRGTWQRTGHEQAWHVRDDLSSRKPVLLAEMGQTMRGFAHPSKERELYLQGKEEHPKGLKPNSDQVCMSGAWGGEG